MLKQIRDNEKGVAGSQLQHKVKEAGCTWGLVTVSKLGRLPPAHPGIPETHLAPGSANRPAQGSSDTKVDVQRISHHLVGFTVISERGFRRRQRIPAEKLYKLRTELTREALAAS